MSHKDPSLLDIWKELTVMNQTLTNFCKKVNDHDSTLYGTPSVPQGGLVWIVAGNQKEIGLIKKVAFALVPTTGIVWSVAEYFLRAVRP